MQSGHKFAHSVTAELSWHVQNCGLIVSLFSKWEQNEYLQDLGYEMSWACHPWPSPQSDLTATAKNWKLMTANRFGGFFMILAHFLSL